MNSGLIARSALRAVASETTEKQLHLCGKIVRDLEKAPDESSLRLCADLRFILKNVKTHGIAEQVIAAGDLLKRIKKFDPRNSKRFVTAALIDMPKSAVQPGSSSEQDLPLQSGPVEAGETKIKQLFAEWEQRLGRPVNFMDRVRAGQPGHSGPPQSLFDEMNAIRAAALAGATGESA
jgi:hypothetical protein